jgi:hypothetical protein
VITPLKKPQIELTGALEGCEVFVTTLQGKLALKDIVTAGEKFLIDLSSLRSGCYMFSIQDKRNKKTQQQIISVY